MADHKYYAELGIDAGTAVKAFSETAKEAQGLQGTLDALDGALRKVSTTQVSNAKTIGDNLKMYQQLSSAVGTYARASKALADPAAVKGQQQMGAALASMRKELQGLSGQGALSNTKQIKENLDLYKQLADVSRSYTASLKNEAAAVREVASAGGRGGNAAALQAETTAARENNTVKQQLVNTNQEHERGLAATRYALYEIAAAYTAASAAALALPVAGAKQAIEMEAQFAHVARTTQAADAPLANLRDRFVDLSTEIPVTFEELSKIGTLGAQMGIASSNLESFADTVAKFSATTDVSVDQAAMSFGRLSNMMQLTEADYEHLGASISELGTASVATESEILSIAESIATSANMAGFSADEVVGLSTAMASLRIRPEMARGALMRVFRNITTAAAEGNETLTAFAQTLGITEQQAAALWDTDPSQFFQRLAQSIGELDKASATLILPELGINNARDVELINRLANGYEVYADSMSLAQDAYARGDYLEKESGVIFETTAASLEKLGSAFRGFLDSFGQASLGPVQFVAELLIDILNGLRDLPAWAKGSAAALLAVVGAVAAMRAGIALALASMRAFRLVNQQLQVDSMRSVLSLRNLGHEFRTTFMGGTASATAATGAVRGFTASLAAAQGVMGKTTVAARTMWTAVGGPIGIVAIIATIGSALWGLASAHENAADKARAHAEVLADGAGGFEAFNRAVLADTRAATEEGAEVFMEFGGAVREATSEMQTAPSKMGVYLDAHGRLKTVTEDATAAIRNQTLAIGENADEFLRNALVQSDVIQQADPQYVQELINRGFSLDKLLTSFYQDGVAGAQAYIDGRIEGLQSEFGRLDRFEQAQNQRLFQGMRAILEGGGEDVASFVTMFEDFEYQAMIAGNAGLDAFEDIEEGAAGASEEVKGLSEEFDDLVEAMFGLVDAEAAVYAAMDKLGESIDANGTSFDTMTEAGRANMSALKGLISSVAADISQQVENGVLPSAEAGAQAFAAYVESIMADLSAMGVDTSQFDFFHDHLENLFGSDIVVGVDTDPAISALSALQSYAQGVFESLSSQGVSAGMAASGARYSAQAASQGVGTGASLVRHQRLIAESRARNAAKERERHVEQYQAQRQSTIETARARAEQERLAREADKASKSTKDTADQAKKLREEIAGASDEGRIFDETMKELSSAFKDTLDRFGGHQAARDSMEGQLIAMREAAQSAKDEVKDLREEARSLRQEARDSTIEAQQSEIFASVARRYGDTTRFDEYSNEAKKARENAREKSGLARAAEKEATALDKNRLSLTGYSSQAIENREQVRRLQSEMAELILKYAETGATTEEVTRYAEGLRRKFIDQLTQMGYNRTEVVNLSGVFIDLKRDIERVPREVRVRAHAEVAEARKKLNDLAKGRTVPITVKSTNDNLVLKGTMEAKKLNVSDRMEARRVRTNNFEYGDGITSNWRAAGGGTIPGSFSGPLNQDNKLVVGANGPEGMVRSGEEVIQVPAVNHYGRDFFHALNNMKVPIMGPSQGARGGGHPAVQAVELLPHNIQQIARAVSTVLAVDGKVLAATNNKQNASSSRRGV